MPFISRARAATALTFGHGAAPGNPRTIAADKFAEIVREKTGGAVEITVAGSAQLGNDNAMLTSLRTGALSISANSQGTASSLVPELAAFGLPFLFQDAATAIKTVSGSLTDQLAAKFDEVGIVLLGFWDNGIRNITNSKRPIKEPADLKGLKIRTPSDPATIDIFESLGAATQQIAFSELYVALQQGVVDGQENPLTNIASAKLYEVNKYISLSAHKWESTPILMSKIAWAQIDDAGKAAIKVAMAECTTLQIGLSADGNKKLLGEFKANPAVEVNEVDLAAFRRATAGVLDKWQNKPFGGFVKDLRSAVGA
nr:TRAP transporter substrate-binding protein [Hartmannibacter diazotrophicus]